MLSLILHKSDQGGLVYLKQITGFGDVRSYAAKLHLWNAKMIGDMKKRNTIGESGIVL